MSFWNRKKKIVEQPVVEPLPEVTVVDSRDQHCPEMKRTYKAPLSNGRSMEIEFRTTYWNSGRRDTSAMIFQADRSKYLFFRTEAVADEILDPELVPQVQKYLLEMFRLDQEFLNSDPKEYTDSKGIKWTRS